jgi:predicted naringenin-chalcone synthase
MAECTLCKAETQLYENGVPICLECCEARTIKRKPSATAHEIRTALFQDLLGATVRNGDARREFDKTMGQFPSGLPHPDGVQRIKNASNALSLAREEMATAHNRLNDYLSRGIVPDDLKRSE